MAYDQNLEIRIEKIVSSWENVKKKKMFGGVCHMLNNKIFCGIHKNYLVLRLGEKEAENSLQSEQVKVFDITGRPMKGWVMVKPSGFSKDNDLKKWLTKAKKFMLESATMEENKNNKTKKKKFKAVIEGEGKGGAFITIPFDVEEFYGQKRVKIKATFDNEPYQGSLVRMGSENHILIVRKDIRKKIGKGVGDKIEITLEEDKEPRKVIIADDIKKVFHDIPEVKTFFDTLSFTHQKEYINWIEAAKKTETRSSRIDKAIEMMKKEKRGL